MNFVKQTKMNSGRAIQNFARAKSIDAALPWGGLFIARPNLPFLDLNG